MCWTSCSFFPGQRHPLFGFAVLDGLDRHVHRFCLIGPLQHRFRVAPCIKIGSVDRREKRPRIQVPKMAPKTGQKRGHPLGARAFCQKWGSVFWPHFLGPGIGCLFGPRLAIQSSPSRPCNPPSSEARGSLVAEGAVELHAGRVPEKPGVAPKEGRDSRVAGSPEALHAGRGPEDLGVADTGGIGFHPDAHCPEATPFQRLGMSCFGFNHKHSRSRHESIHCHGHS